MQGAVSAGESEGQHNCLVEYVVYMISMLVRLCSAFFPSRAMGGGLRGAVVGSTTTHNDAGLHMRRGCRQICCVNIHNSTYSVLE